MWRTTHLKRHRYWERLKAGEGDDRGGDGWMASLTQRTWIWLNSRSWWWTGRPGMLQSMGLQRVRLNWLTKLNQTNNQMKCNLKEPIGMVTFFILSKKIKVSEEFYFKEYLGSLVAQRLKRLPARQETLVRSLGPEDPLEKEMATHSSILAWKIPWTEKPGRLQSIGSQRVGHD